MPDDDIQNRPDLETVRRRLLAPGSPFEVTEESVLGETIPVYKTRPRSLRDLLEGSAGHGDKEYLVFSDGRRWSYRDHLADVASVASALETRFDIGPGDSVAILAANAPEWILGYWAITSLGAVVVAMNGWWAPDEIRAALDLTKPKLILADERRIERLNETGTDLPIVSFERDFESLRLHATDASLPTASTHPIAEDDPALLLFTSGTTGRPKAALISHRTLIAFTMTSFFLGAMRGLTEDVGGRESGAILAPFPLFHLSGTMGSVTAGLAGGVKTVWPMGRFDPAEIIRLSQEENVTNWSGATTHLFRLLNHPDIEKLDADRFTNISAGGSASTPELLRAIADRFPHLEGNLGSGYGSTESGGLISYASASMLREAANCVGCRCRRSRSRSSIQRASNCPRVRTAASAHAALWSCSDISTMTKPMQKPFCPGVGSIPATWVISKGPGSTSKLACAT